MPAGSGAPAGGNFIAELLAGRPWLFADESYHIDISHLAAVVRMSLLVSDRDVMALAADLTEYGRRLSPRLLFEGPPPFEKIFDDHGIYLRALLGHEIGQAIDHFQGKLAAEIGGEPDECLPGTDAGEPVVDVGQVDAAIDVASDHLAGLPDSALACPSVAKLCQRAGQPERLARIARDQGDVVTFTAALLECVFSQAEAPLVGWALPTGLRRVGTAHHLGLASNRHRQISSVLHRLPCSN